MFSFENMESSTSRNEYISEHGQLVNELIIQLITDLPISKTSACSKKYKNYHYEHFAFMLIQDIPTLPASFRYNELYKLLHQPSHSRPGEHFLNQKFHEFTKVRRKFRSIVNPRYFEKHCSAEVLKNMKNIEEQYILTIMSARNNQAQLYPSYLYSIANWSPQDLHCDISSFSDSKQEFQLLIGIQEVSELCSLVVILWIWITIMVSLSYVFPYHLIRF